MNWKEFLKPTSKKILIFVVLLALDFIFIKIAYNVFMFPFYFALFSLSDEVIKAYTSLIIGILGLFLWYFIACLITNHYVKNNINNPINHKILKHIWNFLKPSWSKLIITTIMILVVAVSITYYTLFYTLSTVFLNPVIGPITVGVPYLISCIIVFVFIKLKQVLTYLYNDLKSRNQIITMNSSKIKTKKIHTNSKIKTNNFNLEINIIPEIKNKIYFLLLIISLIIIGYFMQIQLKYNVPIDYGIIQFIIVVLIVPLLLSYSIFHFYEKYRGKKK